MSELQRKVSQFKQIEKSWNLNDDANTKVADTEFDFSSVSNNFKLNDIYNFNGYHFQTYYSSPKFSDGNEPIVFITHHGAGSCGMTFGFLNQCLRKKAVELNYNSIPGLFTFDFRGHGKTNILNADDSSNYKMDINQLTSDFIFILNEFITLHSQISNIYLVGHSLGASVLTNALKNHSNEISDFNKIKGLVSIDIVEETAIKSLNLMDHYLLNLPQKFNSIDEAVNWHFNKHLLNNKLSAKFTIDRLLEKNSKDNKFYWITDLRKSKPFWKEWFKNLSSNFIEINTSIPKLLILANNDYLDKYLIIGQMQGKYQLIVFNNSNNINTTLTTMTKVIDSNNVGHFIHQDIPQKLAITLLEFVQRNSNCFQSLLNEDLLTQRNLINSLNKKWLSKKE